jgi:hypothetical protein
MSRGVQIFRHTDVKKATIAVLGAGLEVQRVEIDRAGKIVIVTGAARSQAPETAAEKAEVLAGADEGWDDAP